MANIESFNHKMAAHCESGTVTALLNHAGMEISEPLVFGISGGLFFGYLKMPSFSFPMVVLRNKPGSIRKNIGKQLGIRFTTYKFKNPVESEQKLDSILDKQIPVALQTDFFYLDYIPSWYRVHINVHYITVVGKNGTKYNVSDCYFPRIAEVETDSLRKGRFAGGMSAPNGFMFNVESVPKTFDLNKAIKKGIKQVTFNMLKIPIPILGVKGIKTFGKKIVEWPKYAKNVDDLSHAIMRINTLFEDQGTGGGGFRFIYASFLREASEHLNMPVLNDMAKNIMTIGDHWREFSVFVAKLGKNRDLGSDRFLDMREMIYKMADEEEIFFKDLAKITKSF